MADLRDYQATALAHVKDAARRGVRRMILQMPTGAGKTRLAAEIVNGAKSKSKRVLFTVPAISLVDQTLKMFADEGIKNVGVIQADHILTDWSQPIQVASVQTLMRRNIPQADVVIRDEAHRLFKFDIDWMKNEGWRDIPFIGLSATPWTKGLGHHYEELIIGTTTAELIAAGWLVTYRVFAPTHPDLKGVKISLGDYVESQLAEVMCKAPLMADAVDTWKKHAEERPTICFAVDCAHARALRDAFMAGGVPADYMDAHTPLNARSAIRQRFERGEIKVICNVDVMGIGIDWPDVSCISYCRPTRSEIRYVQNIGRGLRTHSGKKDLLILDHSDTTLRLGFVEDIHHKQLSGAKERAALERKKPLPKYCRNCHMLRPPFTSECPNCGFKSEPLKGSAQHGAGELVEYTELPDYKAKAEKFSMMDKTQFLAEARGYAIERGFNLGWAAHKYKEKFGVWPNGNSRVAPITPSPRMRAWIRGRLARYAIAKNAMEVKNGNT
jgi:superfamily II DNA or RNA helicase